MNSPLVSFPGRILHSSPLDFAPDGSPFSAQPFLPVQGALDSAVQKIMANQLVRYGFSTSQALCCP